MASLVHDDYTVGWICALETELSAAMAVIDKEHPPLQQSKGDFNSYTLCRICNHNVVLACLPAGQIGNNSAASVAARMIITFPSIRFALMVGVGGGVPSTLNDIRLGDIVVSKPGSMGGGVVQYDYGKTVEEGRFVHTGTLNAPPKVALTVLNTIMARHRFGRVGFLSYLSVISSKLGPGFSYPGVGHDRLFKAEYNHKAEAVDCASCRTDMEVPRSARKNTNPVVHYGIIASGNEVIRDGPTRDRLMREHKMLCFEMEAAGLMNEFPCIVVRGICDYSDSHKNKEWQSYAAATAASYAKELLSVIPSEQVARTIPVVASSAPVAATILSPTPPQAPETVGFTESNEEQRHPHGLNIERSPGSPTARDNIIRFFASAFTVITDSFLPWNRAALGRLVLNLDDPGQDYCPRIPFDVSPDEISVKNFQAITESFSSKKGSGFAEKIRTFFRGHENQSQSPPFDLTARGAVTQQLLNSGAFFDRLIQDKEIRCWIERLQGKKDPYLIVGIHALLNFEVTVNLGNESLLPNSISASQSERPTKKFLAPGDRIIGVQYRRLRIEGHSSSSIDSSFLDETTRWRKYYNLDFPRTAEDLDVDILEARLDEAPDIAAIREDIPVEYEMEVYQSDTGANGESFIFLVISPVISSP
jgi:nucleoside phosphorylase